MSYAKVYKPTSIRLVGTQKGDTVYLFLFWNYGFGVSHIGADGEVTTKYHTLRISTGHSVPTGCWLPPVSEQGKRAKEEGDFSPAFRKTNRATVNAITADVEDLRRKMFDFYTKHVQESATKPHPDQITEAVRTKAVSIVRVKLSDFIRAHARSPLVTHPRTAAKLFGLADMLDVLVEARKVQPLKSHMMGSGDIFVDSMSEADWIDLRTMYQRAGCQLTRPFRKAVGQRKDGTSALKWIDQKGVKPYYSVNSLEKAQQNLKTVLAIAKKRKMTKLDVNTLDKVSRKEFKKEHLESEEIATIVSSRHLFPEPYLLNTWKLFVVELMTGVPVGGMAKLLERRITMIKGKHITFPAIWSVREKTTTPHLIPVFQPAFDLLSGQDKPHMIADTHYNTWLKIICERMGLDRAFQVIEPKANGTMVDTLASISSQTSSHTCRRSLKVLLEGDLQIPRERVCDMFGHSYGDKSADRVYMTISPERSAELLVRAVIDDQDTLPLQLIGDCVRHNEKAKRA